MPFKSDKQRKWMHANEPEMAKKWEKEEAIKGKLQNLIKQELKINKLEAFKPKGISQWKKMVLLPKSKMYFDPTTQYFWLMGPGGEPDWEDDPIEPKDWDYKRTLSRLSSKDKSIIKKSLRGKGNWKEATTTSAVPSQNTPTAFSKSTQNAIDVDDEDDEKNESTKEYGKTLDKIAKDRQLKSISKKDRDILIKIAKLMKRANESIDESGILYRAGVKKYGKDGMKKIQQAAGKRKSHAEIGAIKDKYEKDKKESVNEARLVGYDKSYLDNAKKKLKVPHEITNIEYKKTRQHDKFVKISYRLKWKPGTRLDTEEKDVNVFYDSPERLKMIGKTLKLKLKESVNEDNIKFSKEEMAQLHKDGKVEKNGHTIEFGESINEKIAKPYSNHLRKAQEEIEYMISNGPTPDGDDGVYDRPNQAMKLLQIAQKSLGKIK